MSRRTYGTSAVLALSGTAAAVGGIFTEQYKVFGAGVILILGGSVFALLYLGAARKQAPRGNVHPAPSDD
jgi:hypothetical protein